MKATRFTYGQASAYIFPLDEDTYAISNVWSTERGVGHGTGVMEEIINWADAYEVTLRLVVQRYGNPNWPGLDNQQLIRFYEKFGFVADDAKPPVSMTRLSQKLHAS